VNKPIEVDPVGTFACKTDDSIHLQLRLPSQQDLPTPSVRLRHRRTEAVIETTAAVQPSGEGQLLVADVPRGQVEPGLWWVAVKADADSSYRKLEARLLINDKQPLALLAGAMPDTKMAPPAPRTDRRGSEGRVHRRAADTADRLLRHLPEERAARYRGRLARLARRVRL
jgi:hypothetical protein